MCASWLASGQTEAPADEQVETPEPAPSPVDTVLAGNPYRAIVARNAFRLKDPVPPPEPAPPPPPPPEVPKIDVKIAGLAEIGGVRYAYLMIPDPERQGQYEYPALTDDPRQARGVRHRSGIEVREIDLKSQTVRLVNGGIETTLSLKEDGVKSAPAVAAKPATQVASIHGAHTATNVRRPGATVPGATAAAAEPAAAEPLIFSRNRSRSGNNVLPNSTGTTGGGQFTGNAGNPRNTLTATPNTPVTFPTRPLRTDSGSQQPPPTPPAIPIEQQYQTLIEQRRVADSLGVPLPPIPGLPTPPPPVPQQ